MVCTGKANCPFTAESLMSALGAVVGLSVSLKEKGPLAQPAYLLVAPVAMWAYVYSKQDPDGTSAGVSHAVLAHAVVGAAGALIGGFLYGMDKAVLIPAFVGAASGFGVFGVLVLLLLV